jgi:hypothetical protein
MEANFETRTTGVVNMSGHSAGAFGLGCDFHDDNHSYHKIGVAFWYQGLITHSINGNGYEWCSTGGGSGGGSIKIAYKGTFTNNGTINVNGGLAGIPFNDGAGNYSSEGGNGGNGTYTALQVS